MLISFAFLFQTSADFGQTTRAECIFLKIQVRKQKSCTKCQDKIKFWCLSKRNITIYLFFPGEFVKTHGLQAGDLLSIHRSRSSATYVCF